MFCSRATHSNTTNLIFFELEFVAREQTQSNLGPNQGTLSLLCWNLQHGLHKPASNSPLSISYFQVQHEKFILFVLNPGIRSARASMSQAACLWGFSQGFSYFVLLYYEFQQEKCIFYLKQAGHNWEPN